MKAPHVVGLVVASVLVTIAIEESRIAALKTKAQSPETTASISKTAAKPDSAGADENGPVRTKGRAELKPETPAKTAASDEESFAKTARKMWDNPAGKSMMSQGVKMAVAMMYQDFIDGLDLSKEEADYFKTLLGKETSAQQAIGMKMLGATAEEQKTLAEEIKKQTAETTEEIKKFLNNDADYKSFTDYKERLPEHQQLDGIRTAMATKGAPLDPETEARLMDAMHRARTQSKAPDLSGPEAMTEMANGNLVESFEKNWEAQQESLRAETSGILNSAQMEAFQEYRKQLREMQLMGLKMAEKMMQGDKSGGE